MIISAIELEQRRRSFRFYHPRTYAHHLCVLSKSPMVFGIHGQRRELPAGQAVFYRPGDVVDFSGAEEFMTYDLVAFDMSESEAAVYEALPLPFVTPVPPPNFPEAATCLRSIYHLFYSSDRYRLEKLDINLRNLIYSLASGDPPEDRREPEGALRRRMEQLQRLLSDDPARIRSARQAAGLVCISASRFEHLYRQFFQLTFGQDLIRARIKRACVLLRSTDWTVARIAQEVGYESEAYFYRLFKRETGHTPGDYRGSNILGL